jgi:hypothetical protein
MQPKSAILAVLGFRTLKRIVDKSGIDASRRSIEAMRSALARSRKVTVDELLRHMRKDEIKAACERMGLSTAGRRDELLDRMKRVYDSVTVGLPDGSRIKSYKKGWAVVDRHGLVLADPESATWVMPSQNQDAPPAIYPTAAAAYLAWMRSQQVAGVKTT